MDNLDAISTELTDHARAVINAIWEYDREKGKCIPTTALFVRLGKDVVASGLKALNGSIVIERSGDGTKRCCLTFLGKLITSDGERGKELLKRLLEFIQTNLLADPEFNSVNSESVRETLGLNDDEFAILSDYYWMSPFTGGGGGQKGRWTFSVPYYMKEDLPLETDLTAYFDRYAMKDFDAKLPVLYEEAKEYQYRGRNTNVSARVFYSWQSDLPNATNRGFIEKALEDAAKSIRADGSISVDPVIDRDTAGVPGSPDIASTILEKIERADVFVCDISIINREAERPAPNPNVLIELGYALKALGPDRIVLVLNSTYGAPELLPFDLRMRRVIPYKMQEDNHERAVERRKLQRMLTEGLRTIFGGFADQMPGELIEPQTPAPQIGVTSFLSSSDEDFESYVTTLLSTNNEAELNIVIEKLRDATVSIWDLKRAEDRVLLEQILDLKEKVFLPAMRKVVLLALMLIKFKAPVNWFTSIADLLEQVFNCSHALSKVVPETLRQLASRTLQELGNHMVPALESLIATYLIAGYEVSKKLNTTYTAEFFPRIVDWVGDPDLHLEEFFLFWPIAGSYWQPNRQRDLLVLDRYGKDNGIASILGSDEAIRAAALQLDCLVDWHSFISTEQSDEPETRKFFKEKFPRVSTVFEPNFTHEPLAIVFPFMEQLWRSLQDGSTQRFVIDARLVTVIARLDLARRRHLFVKFVLYAEMERRRRMHQQNKASFPTYWPKDIEKAIREVGALGEKR